MRDKLAPVVLWFCAFSGILSSAVVQSETHEWALSEVCPAGFQEREGGCYLQSFYSGYKSLRESGVGGLKTGLPALREGFSAQQIDLGRLLFFDPLLSVDGDMACSSCHQPARGFSDGLGGSVGRHGEVMTRSAPTLWNVGFLRELFWDARADSLEEQMQGPLFSSIEMANTPENLLASLQQDANYPALFAQAFGEKPLSLEQVYTALTAFESSLVSLSSRYDLYANGFHEVLTQTEIEGMNVFRSFVARCAECHTPPAFTNQQIAVIGTPELEGMPRDPGVQAITGDASQRGGFRVPTLRNIELTAPYMHSGRFKTLRDAVAFYTGGRGHAVPEGEHLSLHWHIWEPDLADHELDLLVAFLKTLTDQSFMPVLPQKVPSGLKPVATEFLTY
ncbi:Cytochrome c551 peroxidase [Zhongshania aliphaticivorans]|uniref:Cytochrome c551 peroxidase n=1 Tax=Zhongshania aliphaticivorans TaxID=1470434 RepID=A0A5S9QUC1_9GAMM|nr:cytochrome c peroxidase [Zhongshania aliphaticivorans]CAA0110198.1 Cytochrome c551 peroxidase [Zhongshania aliphaticivorans]CAA0118031.1 Cytochrome c551 peroxidase [Zhongshania aliphaticivorans]CAA0121942.1 Cytochrome c551 peroxidase [Zhongshania aliphaticivorans]